MTRALLVRDELSEIVEAVRYTLDRHPDFLLTTGGLGPTFDDMTLEGIAYALGRPLELNNRALQMIESRGRRLVAEGRRKEFNLTDPTKKMAFLPQEAVPLQNPKGSAPGVLLKSGKTRIIAMPGVPYEMKAIFSKYVEPLIIEMSSNLNYYEKSLVVKGIGESSLSPYVDRVMAEFPEVYLKSHPRNSERLGRFIELHVSALCESPKDSGSIVEEASLRVSDMISQGGATVREANEEDARR
jgi:molybdopterin-biosynthesis enzyme MoeA-like protein